MTDKNDLTPAAKKVWTAIGYLVAAAAFIAFWALLFQFGWNVGVVGVALATGGTLGHISFHTAVGGSVLTAGIRRILVSLKQTQPINIYNVERKELDDRASSD